MEGRKRNRSIRGLAAGIAATTACLALASSASATQEEYDEGYALGVDAYKYGLPIVNTDKTYREQTSVNVTDGEGHGRPNEWNHIRELVDPANQFVVAPNYDTLYSLSWLNLSKQPQVMHLPKVKHRYFVAALLDPYTEDFANPGTVNDTKLPGDFAVVGPDDRGIDLPKGVKRIDSEYNRVWVGGRTYVDSEDPADLDKVHAIQDKLELTPLSKYGVKGWERKPPKNPDTDFEPATLPTGMAYYDVLGEQLAKFPPPAADAPELEKLSAIGVGPGLTPSTDSSLSADTVAGMTQAVADGRAKVQADLMADFQAGFAAHNGYFVPNTNEYGTDYKRRAYVAQVGLGALTSEQAVYPLTQVDRTGVPLNGAKRYQIHIPEGQLPPVNDFWSMTLYDPAGFFVPNSIDRYLINDRTDLHVNEDGSVDIWVQANEPTDPEQAQNWLPSPASGGFRLQWRLYGTETDQIQGILDGSGWDAPAVMALPE